MAQDCTLCLETIVIHVSCLVLAALDIHHALFRRSRCWFNIKKLIVSDEILIVSQCAFQEIKRSERFDGPIKIKEMHTTRRKMFLPEKKTFPEEKCRQERRYLVTGNAWEVSFYKPFRYCSLNFGCLGVFQEKMHPQKCPPSPSPLFPKMPLKRVHLLKKRVHPFLPVSPPETRRMSLPSTPAKKEREECQHASLSPAPSPYRRECTHPGKKGVHPPLERRIFASAPSDSGMVRQTLCVVA